MNSVETQSSPSPKDNFFVALYKSYVKFWLRPRDTATISVCRILVGCVSILKSFHVLGDAPFLYGAANPMVSVESSRIVWPGFHLTVFNFVSDHSSIEALAMIVPVLHLMAAVAVTAGFRTNFSLFVLLLAACSMSFRNLMAVTGADSYQVTTVFLLMFSRCGGRYSVDYWLARRAGRFYRTWSIPAVEYLIRLQFLLLYVSAAGVKLLRPIWQQGDALYYVLRQKNFELFVLPPWMLTQTASKIISWGTLAIEALVPIGLCFKRLRYPVLIVAAAFHLGMHSTLNIPLFQLFVLASLVSFVDPKDIRKLERRLLTCRKRSST